MRIYHNIPALTAYNALNSTNNAMDKTIQKLSTGLRINSAADDAAGFAISEKMRSQISGLEIAIRNTQDATSMLQTAEGALGETNSMLQRMRELAVQASNDTLTSQDRSYIQLEIDQLADQIDRIAKTTQFNKKRLLDGSSAGITSTSNLDVKAYVKGSLRSIDQFGQKKSFEGNYKIQISLDPNQTGSGQVQKSAIMTIKHPNVITDVEINTDDGVTNVTVDSLPAGDYTVIGKNTAADAGATMVGTYGFADEDGIQQLSDTIGDMFKPTVDASPNNASIIFEVVSLNKVTDPDDDSEIVESVTLKARSNILKADGTIDNAIEENIIFKIDPEDPETPSVETDLSKLVLGKDYDEKNTPKPGNFKLSYTANSDINFSVGAKFVYNVVGVGVGSVMPDMQVNVTGEVDPNWKPYTWEGEKSADDKNLVSKTLTYNLDSSECQKKEIHFRNFYVNSENGTEYEGDIILTTDKNFDAEKMAATGDTLAKFTATYIGKTATGDTKLRDLNTFWNSSGVFMLDDPKTITIAQGNGQSATVTLYATDTLNELRAKFNDAIANGLGQIKLVDGNYADKFCTFVEPKDAAKKQQGMETVGGTFIFRSLMSGKDGDLTFSGDEDLINTLAFNVVQESTTSAFMASIYDAHTGTPIQTNVKVSDNRLIGVLHENVDIEFGGTANIKAEWSESDDNFILTQDSDGPFEAVIHIVDSSTVFQIGANEGEDIAIDIGNMSAASLGVTNINVATRESASKSIGQIDAAINKVSTQRAKIGAYQNALEYTSENLTTTMTNLTAAESRIRDADMAQLMMQFVKLQILNQSGTSMLAQANQLPQSILSLLNG